MFRKVIGNVNFPRTLSTYVDHRWLEKKKKKKNRGIEQCRDIDRHVIGISFTMNFNNRRQKDRLEGQFRFFIIFTIWCLQKASHN